MPLEDTDTFSGTRVALLGRFGGMNQREAGNVLRSFGMVVSEPNPNAIDWVVVGADESPLAEADLIRGPIRDAAATGKIEILHETELWQRLGLVEIQTTHRQYYTPVMLAHLLGVSVRVIRRWHRRGLIKPVQTLHRLQYFDFQEVTTARRLARWIASGANPKVIEQSLVELVEVLPDIQRPLDQLSILVEGKQVLLRGGEGLVETGGQLRFDFDLADDESIYNESAEPTRWPELAQHDPPATLSMFSGNKSSPEALDPLIQQAFDAEDEGDFQVAIDYLHIAMGRDGPRSDWCFQLAELLYRVGDVTAARERYYMTIELDPDFVEARASLGNVLVETGQLELAVSAFRGALSLHDDYSDAHYHLARLLDRLDHDLEADHHWKRFLELAPDSPWADEARSRLATSTT
ncbi:Tetratricopeptide repeat protein [Rubripirellula obstinata]|uniref:Tetratricopeptide repeat protein n=1 Tax=Rubripirellula obstinata TaxID=406547 RepID=A0A5B1CPG7_9BACT|nr:tetratricopeptide repeat protein [Rubripirellula obstinata]KAA1262252.1 Tetratricopeptide repeat protein [Rubripirellula obstinata]